MWLPKLLLKQKGKENAAVAYRLNHQKEIKVIAVEYTTRLIISCCYHHYWNLFNNNIGRTGTIIGTKWCQLLAPNWFNSHGNSIMNGKLISKTLNSMQHHCEENWRKFWCHLLAPNAMEWITRNIMEIENRP